MTSNITFRFATPKDTPTIFKFIRALAKFEKLSHQVKTTPKQLKQTLFGKKRYAEVLFAQMDQKPVGFALFFHNYSTFLGKPGIYLEDLFVLPQARSLGVGQKLLLELVKLAKKRKCGRVEWWVLNWNKKAIFFYEKKFLAKPMSEWTVYRLDSKTIQKILNKK